MDSQKINAIATSVIAFFTFLATLAGFIQIANIKIWNILIISEIYIVMTLLFISWIKEKLK